MKESKNKAEAIGKYLLPGVVTVGFMLLILVVKGIWPFGSNRIDLFDNMQQVAPLYTHLWDWMHGQADLWFDWYTGLGTSVTMSISAFSMLSPFNLLLYLCPRGLILEFISVMTVVKMGVMAVTMYAFLNSRYGKLQYGLKAMLSVMYAFGAYVLLYASCFTPWMDMVALFPLLMMALDNLAKTGKKLFYIIMVAVMFIINYYIAAMALVYILLIGGVFMIFRWGKEQRKKFAWNAGIGTFTGVGLSAFVLIPVIHHLSQSQRGGASESYIKQYFSWITFSSFNGMELGEFQRAMMIYGTAFLIVVIAVGLVKYTKDKKERGFIISLLAIVLIPVISEGTNIIWHFGSYNGYTLRNGFVITFTLICITAFYAEKMFEDKKLTLKQIILETVITAVGVVAYIIIYNNAPIENYAAAMLLFGIIFVVMIVIHALIMGKMKGSYNYKLVMGLIVFEVFAGAYALTGPPKFYNYQAYQFGDYDQMAIEATEDLDIKNSPIDRISNPDLCLNANYPLFMKRGALSSFTAALQNGTQEQAKRWGYSRYFIWTLDSGGTVFTNALLHVTEAVNINELDSEIYTLEKTGTTDTGVDLYSANYVMPFAMVTNDKVSKIDFSKDYTKIQALSEDKSLTEDTYEYNNSGKDWIYMHNYMYTALTGDDEKLVTEYDADMVSDTKTNGGGRVVKYTVDVKGRQAVYMNYIDKYAANLNADSFSGYMNTTISVNGNDVYIPTMGANENLYYTENYNNNLIYLGVFQDETITITITAKDAVKDENSILTVGGLNMNKMESMCRQYSSQKCETSYTNNSVTIKVNGNSDNNYALVPLVKSDNWTCRVNGKIVETKDITGLFTGVALDEGENEIVFTFEPNTKNKAFIISLAILVIMIALMMINHKRKIVVPSWCETAASVIYLAIIAVLAVVMFGIPFICSLFFNLKFI
ncbi:MAG: YfhO family protein [Lachnospira sp.]